MVEHYLSSRSRGLDGPLSATILAIVFSGPWSSILTDVAEFGGYLDERTGSTLDVFFAGVLPAKASWRPSAYAAYMAKISGWYDSEIVLITEPRRPRGSRQDPERAHWHDFDLGREQGWVWSPKGFNTLRAEVEERSGGRWRYSGNSDLLLANVVFGAGVRPEIDWDSAVSVALDVFEDRRRGRWFGEVVETLMRSMESEDGDPYWGMREKAEQDEHGYRGSLSSRVLKYLLLEGLGPWAVGDLAARVFR